MRPSKLYVRLAALAAVLGCATIPNAACSLIIDPSKVQCDTDGDCSIAARGPEFEGYVCGESKVCVRSASYCFTNAQCIDANGGAENFICNQQTHGCVNLKYKNLCTDIRALPGDLRNDDAIIVGMHWGSNFAEELDMGEAAFDLARTDFKETAGGIPRPGGAGASRPVVTVLCDIPPTEIENPAIGREMTDHLLDTVGVKVMVGPIIEDDIQYAVTKAVEKDAYVITIRGLYATAASIKGQNEHSFFAAMDAPTQLEVYAAISTLQEQALLAKNLGRPIRYALATPSDAAQAAEIVPFLQKLKFNGKSGIENESDGNFKYFQYGDDGAREGDPKYNKALADIDGYDPDIIACRGVTCIGLFVDLEKAKPSRYHWVLGFEQWADLDFTAFVPTEESRKRILGFNGRRPDNDPRWTAFKFYFGPKVPDFKLTDFGGGMWDIGYIMHLGLAGLGDEPLTGKSFRNSLLTKLKVGAGDPKILAGPSTINDMITAVQSPGGVLSAGGSQADFEITEKGTPAKPPAEIWCVGKDTKKVKSSGLIYNTLSKKLIGTNDCFQ